MSSNSAESPSKQCLSESWLDRRWHLCPHQPSHAAQRSPTWGLWLWICHSDLDGIRWEWPGVWPGSNGRARWTEFWWFWILNRCDRWKMVVLSQYQYQYHYISLLLITIVYYSYYYFYHHHHHHHDRWMDNRMYLPTVSAFRLDRGSSLASRVATALRQRCGHPRPAVAVGVLGFEWIWKRVSRHGGIPQMDGL